MSELRPAAPSLPIDMRYVTRYSAAMIRSISHKGLKRLYEDDDSRGWMLPVRLRIWTCRGSGCIRLRASPRAFGR